MRIAVADERGSCPGCLEGWEGSMEGPAELVNSIYRHICGHLSKGRFRNRSLRTEARDLNG